MPEILKAKKGGFFELDDDFCGANYEDYESIDYDKHEKEEE